MLIFVYEKIRNESNRKNFFVPQWNITKIKKNKNDTSSTIKVLQRILLKKLVFRLQFQVAASRWPTPVASLTSAVPETVRWRPWRHPEASRARLRRFAAPWRSQNRSVFTIPVSRPTARRSRGTARRRKCEFKRTRRRSRRSSLREFPRGREPRWLFFVHASWDRPRRSSIPAKRNETIR